MTTIKLQLTFKEYVFSRVKPQTNQPIAYTPTTWVGKTVCIIPMDIHTTDRLIESQWNDETQQYELEAETNMILLKTIKQATNIGRVYLPKELVGMDVLIIEAPQLENF